MKQNKDSFNKASTLLALTVIFSSVVYAWTGPSGTPPDNNVATPLNVGVEGQAKLGGLGIGGTFLSSLSAVFDGSATFNGTIKIPTGAGLGKVLTSDASGNVAWQSVPTPTIDTNVIQSRVTGSCAVGQAITAVNANGTVTCGDTVSHKTGIFSVTGKSTNTTQNIWTVTKTNTNNLFTNLASPLKSNVIIEEEGDYFISSAINTCTPGAVNYNQAQVRINDIIVAVSTGAPAECGSGTANIGAHLQINDSVKGTCAQGQGIISTCYFTVVKI